MGDATCEWLATQDLQTWQDPCSKECVQFRVAIVRPNDSESQSVTLLPSCLPMAIYMMGLGHSISKADDMRDWVRNLSSVASEPFVLVVPAKPKKMWWFIRGTSDYSWISGEFRRDYVDLFTLWMADISSRAGIDPARIGLFGFSAGAYAVAEVLAHGCITLSGVGVGGIHGHGGCDLTDDVPVRERQLAAPNFEAFLDRLSRHRGVPWIEATHCVADQESRWKDATMIFDTLSARQRDLGHSPVSVRKLEAGGCDTAVGKKRAKDQTNHNYFGTAFLRRDFFVALFGGVPPVEAQPQPWVPLKGSVKLTPKPLSHAAGTEDQQVAQVGDARPKVAAPAVRNDYNVAAADGSEHLKIEVCDARKREAPAPESKERELIVLQWNAGSEKKRKWREYPPGAMEELVRNFKELGGKGQTSIEIEGYRYTVDFDRMQQVAQHSGHTRRIRLGNAVG